MHGAHARKYRTPSWRNCAAHTRVQHSLRAWTFLFIALSASISFGCGAPERKPNMNSELATAHLRIARPSDDLSAALRFYRDGLGFSILFEFRDHAGFDGVMLGHPGAPYHLEFTRKRGHVASRAPGPENLLVFYLPAPAAFETALARLKATGHQPVQAFNPYWDAHGVTFEDPDGYRIVLVPEAWQP
jgi:catechol 2,3-dioxygenase-like lactoylglutathione lyase family enzyme